MPLRIGETFAGYRVLRLLGSGGMGEVYLVQHPRLPRREALKVLRADISSDPSFRDRFIREADLAADLRHPHIVGIHDRGENDGQLWIAMDYIDGTDLGQLLEQRYPAGMPVELVVPIVNAVASALDYAHRKGLLHRDVKPANIIVADLDADDPSVFLADFGIARPLDDTNGLTTTNMTVGTVAYAAPEQLMGEAMDGRTDQYALAATAYHLLSGVVLFAHSNPAVVISRHLNFEPPVMARLNSGLAELDPVMAVGLAKHPSARFSKCSDFAHALGAARANADQSPATSAGPTASAAVVERKPMGTVSEDRRIPTPTKSIPTRPPPVVVPESAPRWQVIASTLTTIALLAGVAVALVVRPWEDNKRSSNPTSAPTSSTAPVITFASMRDFVSEYYRDLPSHPQDAWAKLDAYAQSQTGEQQFVDFWSTIESVNVISINPRDSTSVTAQLSYVRRGGQTDGEDRWLRVALENGAIMLHESERIGAVGQTTLPPTSSVTAMTTDATSSTVAPSGPNATNKGVLAAFCADNAARLQKTFHESGLDPAEWASDPKNLARFGFQGPGDIDNLYHLVIDNGAPYITSGWSNENGNIQWRCLGQ